MKRSSKADASRARPIERNAYDDALPCDVPSRHEPANANPVAIEPTPTLNGTPSNGWSVGKGLLRTLMSQVDAVAAFCVVWPSDFAYAMDGPDGEGVASNDLFEVPRDALLAAFAVDRMYTRSLAAAWRLELLPPSLQRPPFLIPETTKLTLPICLGGHLLGFAGLALRCALEDAERAWLPAPLERGNGAHASTPTSSEASKLLSPRELEIATYLAEGHSTINVGAILDLSATTVRTYVRRVYAKLNVCSRIELVHRLRS